MQTITIPMRKPHSALQREMIVYPGNVVAFAGRRFGKTDAFVQRLFFHMRRKPGLYWWVGLSWRSASMKRAWRLVSFYARRILRSMGLSEREHINKSTSEIEIPGLGRIWFRSAENPESMAGEGIRGVVLDEFSLMQQIVWTEYVQATLIDYGGWAAFAGVPKGRNWAANLWSAAAGREGWRQLHATSYDNPFNDPAAIDRIRQEVPESLFRQEYLAEVVDDAGGVFRGVAAVSTAVPAGPKPDNTGQYVFGIDWAFSHDYTAVCVMDAVERRQVHLDRFNGVDYSLQRERILALAHRYRPSVIVAEANAMGRPNNEELRRAYPHVQDFTTGNLSKQEIIQALAGAIERGQITLLNDPVQIGELQAYEGERLPGGATRYGAPDGMHDDTVMALALAYQAIATRPRAMPAAQPEQESRWRRL